MKNRYVCPECGDWDGSGGHEGIAVALHLRAVHTWDDNDIKDWSYLQGLTPKTDEKKEKAGKVVDAIITDFTDRRGLRQAWEGIDDGIRAEIKETWTAIVLKGGVDA